jgi:hypothetical protein
MIGARRRQLRDQALEGRIPVQNPHIDVLHVMNVCNPLIDCGGQSGGRAIGEPLLECLPIVGRQVGGAEIIETPDALSTSHGHPKEAHPIVCLSLADRVGRGEEPGLVSPGSHHPCAVTQQQARQADRL